MNKTNQILAEIETVIGQIDSRMIKKISAMLVGATRIFVIGEGRSGLMAKSFAMRLMHLGAIVYVVGETITPAIQEGDTLIAVSGSGTTKNVVWTAEKAGGLNAHVIGVTTNPESALASTAIDVLYIPAATKFRRSGEEQTIQPLGSLFDQCVHIIFDTICLHYADLKAIDNQQAFKQHSNLE